MVCVSLATAKHPETMPGLLACVTFPCGDIVSAYQTDVAKGAEPEGNIMVEFAHSDLGNALAVAWTARILQLIDGQMEREGLKRFEQCEGGLQRVSVRVGHVMDYAQKAAAYVSDARTSGLRVVGILSPWYGGAGLRSIGRSAARMYGCYT